MFGIALLLVVSAACYLFIDYKYPTDARWIALNLNDNRISGIFRVEDAKKDGISEKEIAQHLAQDFSERRGRYKKVLLITSPSVAIAMVLVAAGLVILYREPSNAGDIAFCNKRGNVLIKDSQHGEAVTEQASISVQQIEKEHRIGAPMERKTNEAIKGFSWKSFIAAIIIAAFLTSFMATAAGVDPPKNITTTAMWIYLSIEAWKYWRWIAILPYPLFIFASVISSLIMLSTGFDQSTWPYIIVKGALNIGGLIVFYMLLINSQKEQKGVLRQIREHI